MADSTGSTDGTTTQPADGTTTTSPSTDAFMEIISTVNTEGVGIVFTSGFLLTLGLWALGMKISVAINAIRKL